MSMCFYFYNMKVDIQVKCNVTLIDFTPYISHGGKSLHLSLCNLLLRSKVPDTLFRNKTDQFLRS
jgi:hypothetical protein